MLDLNSPLYDETTDDLIPVADANEKYQELARRHKDLGKSKQHDKRRLALALARAIDGANRRPSEWEMNLMEDAGLQPNELPRLLPEGV